VPSTPGRVLRTLIRRPAGAPGPLPLVVFAHGYNVEPETYEPLLDAWAAAGYLVAAPECPGSARDLPGTPVPDYAAQARDISFVITSLLGGLAGPIAPGEITVAGHSDGGTAVTIMALNAAYTDARVKAYINLAGQIPPDVPGPWATAPESATLLVAVGSHDQYGNLALSTAMFDAARMPKALLVVPGGDHLDTFVASTPSAEAVRAATTRFLALVFAGGTHAFTPTQLRAALEGTGGAQPFSVNAVS
jgi:predicted dienelactone hydrolase